MGTEAGRVPACESRLALLQPSNGKSNAMLNRVISAAILCLFSTSPAWPQGTALPWGQQSDMLAWEVFVQVTAPSGNPQKTGVEFESWASDQDIYQTSPPQWPAVGAPKRLQLQMSALGAARHGLRMQAVVSPQQCEPPQGKDAAKGAKFPANGCIGEEVRRNWASFQYIVSNELFSSAGLAKAFQKGLKVDFPADAIEFKGDWVKVTDLMAWLNLTQDEVHKLYYTNTATAGTTTVEFALVSFHFSTKQIKDWVWADFEHAKNPGRCDDIGCHDKFGAAMADVKPKTPKWQQYGECKKTAAVISMFKSSGIDDVWANYCLKGSQITFMANGKPTLLGNSVIEAINADVPINNSSCITCHAYASFTNGGSPNVKGLDNLVGDVDQKLLQGSVTNDFVWGLLFAR